MQLQATSHHPLRKWQEVTWLLVALLIPLFVNLWVEQQFEASKVWLARSLIWVLAALVLGGWLAGHRPRPLLPAIRNLVFLLFVVVVLSTLLSPDPYIAIFGTLDRAAGVLTQASYLLLFVCVATLIGARGSRRLLSVLILTAVPVGLLGLAQAAGWQPLPVWTDARSSLTTTLGRSNFTGAYLALLLPLTLTAAYSAESRGQRMGYTALAVLELVVIALTQARAAWLGAAAGTGVLLWLRLAPRWPKPAGWLTALGGLSALAGGLLLVLQRGISSGGSIAARWEIWRASLQLLWPRLWLGYGADTLELHFPSMYPPQLVYYQGRGVIVDRAHNWLLDGSLNYGLVATLLFIGLCLLILRYGWQRLARPDKVAGLPPKEGRLEAHWLAACMAGVCAQLVGNLFLFEVAATAVVFWLLLAMVTAATARRGTRAGPIRLPPWLRGGAIAAIVLVVGWATWQGSVRPLLADTHSWRGTQALGRGDPWAAVEEYAAAVEEQPQRTAYRVALALTAAELGESERALKAMNEAIRQRPADPVLHTQLAALYGRGSLEFPVQKAMAYAAYERAAALGPTIGLTYRQYADLALRSGDGALALEQAQRAVDLDATDGISFGILGWAYLQAGHLEAARSAFQQATHWQPGSADFQLGLATVLYQQGRLDAARWAVQSSLALDPGYPPALSLQQRLQN